MYDEAIEYLDKILAIDEDYKNVGAFKSLYINLNE